MSTARQALVDRVSATRLALENAAWGISRDTFYSAMLDGDYSLPSWVDEPTATDWRRICAEYDAARQALNEYETPAALTVLVQDICALNREVLGFAMEQA